VPRLGKRRRPDAGRHACLTERAANLIRIDPMSAATIGSHAPDFTLPDQDRQPVSLARELESNHVVLAFFPAAFSSVCTRELCTLRDQLGPMNHLAKARVLGISVDTPFALKAFANQEKLRFPLLSDFNKQVIRAYDVVNPDMIGLRDIAKRAVVVVGRDGIVKYREVLEDARNEPDYDRLNGALAAL
jgi:peroxiredoxin